MPGAAYVFDATTGNLLFTLANPHPVPGDRFGSSVAISGNTIIVGTPDYYVAKQYVGAVYIFDASTGNLILTLANPTPTYGDQFGCSVAIAGSTVVVGRCRGDDAGARCRRGVPLRCHHRQPLAHAG